MQEQLLDHETRIKSLELSYANLVGEITSVKNGQLQLENTVLKTSQGQSDLLNKLIDNTFDLKKTNVVSRKEMVIAAISGGGVLGILIGAIIKFF